MAVLQGWTTLPVAAVVLFSACLAFGSESAWAACASPERILGASQSNEPNINFTSAVSYQSVAFAINSSYTLHSIEWAIHRLQGAGIGAFGSFAFFTNKGDQTTPNVATQPDTFVQNTGWFPAGAASFNSSGIGKPTILISTPRLTEGIWWLTINLTSGYSWLYNLDPPPPPTDDFRGWMASNDGGASWFDQPQDTVPLVVVKACPSISASPTPSSSPTSSLSPSALPSPSLSPSSSSSPTLTPSSSASPSSSLSPSLSSSPTSSSSLRPSPSPSPTRLCRTNSSFSSSGNPSLNLTSDCQATSSAPATGGSSGVTVGLSSELSEVLLGDSSPSRIDWQLAQVNESATGVTYVYSAANITVGSMNATVKSFETTYLFTRVASKTNFSGLLFDVPTNFIKWSIKLDRYDEKSLTDHEEEAEVGGGEAMPLTLRYELSQYFNLTTSGAPAMVGPTTKEMVQKVNVSEQVTRYLLFLCTSCLDGREAITGQLDVLDYALIDGHLQRINHSVIVVTNNNDSASSNGRVSFALELMFPAFSRSLIYDPSLGLLLSSSSSSSSGGGSDDDAVVIGVAIAIPIAIMGVLMVLAGLMIVSWLRWRHKNLSRSDSAVHFDSTEEEGAYSTL